MWKCEERELRKRGKENGRKKWTKPMAKKMNVNYFALDTKVDITNHLICKLDGFKDGKTKKTKRNN